MDYKMQTYMMNRGRDRRMPMAVPYNMRDMRNPYGSRGGYVSSRAPRRDHAQADPAYYESNPHGRIRDRRPDYMPYDYAEHTRYSPINYGGDYAGFHDMNDFGDYAPDDYGGGYLTKDELKRWEKKLYGEMEKGECDMLSEEKILKRAKEVGIKYDEFTEDEFVVTVLMLYTDYCRTLGKANIDMYVKMAKDFLEDKDVGVKYGEKLTAYYDHVVNV